MYLKGVVSFGTRKCGLVNYVFSKELIVYIFICIFFLGLPWSLHQFGILHALDHKKPEALKLFGITNHKCSKNGNTPRTEIYLFTQNVNPKSQEDA